MCLAGLGLQFPHLENANDAIRPAHLIITRSSLIHSFFGPRSEFGKWLLICTVLCSRIALPWALAQQNWGGSGTVEGRWRDQEPVCRPHVLGFPHLKFSTVNWRPCGV